MRSNMNMFKIMVTLCICTFVFAADAVDGGKMTKAPAATQANELPSVENNNVIDKPKSVGVSIEGINIHQNNVDIEAIGQEINPNAEKVSANSYDQGQLEYKKVLLYLAGDDQELINKINNSTFEAQEEGMEKEEEDSRNPGCPMDGGYGYYGSDNLPADCSTTYTTSCQWGGEIHTSTVVSGNTYTYSTCNGSWDSQLTLYDAAGNELAYSDDACSAQSEIVWESTIDGDVYLEIDKYYCADYNSCIQLDVSCTAPAPSTDVKFTLHDQWDDSFEGFLSFNGTDMTDAAGGGDSEYSFSLVDGAYNYTYTCNAYCSEHSWTVTAGATVLGSGSGSDGLTNYSFNVGGPPPVYGCTDIDALNYNSDATDDDGSCSYPGGTCATAVALSLPVDLSGSTCGSNDDYTTSSCSSIDSYANYYIGGDDYVYTFTTTVDGTLSASVSGNYAGLHLTSGCVDDGACIDLARGGGGGSFITSLPAGTYYATVSNWPSPQCMDFNMTLAMSYEVAGCMDPNAPQYNADATLEDGSCSYPGMDCCYFGYCEDIGYIDYTLNCQETSCYNYSSWGGDGWCDTSTACAAYGCDGGDCSNDCAGVCNGSGVEDCAEVCNGSAVYDDCGVCNGDGTSCACDDLTVEGCDSYGDGWDGASLTIGTWSWGGPASTGGGNVASCETTTACVDLTVANTITMGGGSYAGEHSWSISDAAGNELAAGGDPYGGCIGTGCPVYGCLLAGADNYNPFADLDDGSCNPWPGAEVSYWNSSYPGSFWDCNLAYYLHDNDNDGIVDLTQNGGCDDNPAPYEAGYGANTACAEFGCDGGECEDCLGDCLGSAMIDACGTCNGDCTESGGGCTDLQVNGQVFVDDVYGDTCAYYENGSDTPNYWCAYEFMDGVSAMDACCSCGGGELVTGTISCADPSGDTNDDGETNVTDIVLLVSSILETASLDDCEFAASDLTGDGTVNVLDVIGIIDIILGGGTARLSVETPSTLEIIKSSNGLSYKTDVDGLVGFEMTIRHSSGFELNLSKNAYIADAKTTGDLTKIVVVNAGGTELFTSNGDFEIVEVLAGTANGAIESSVSIIPEVFGLSSAYPNPFNPTTSLELSVPVNGQVTVQVYNLMGQVVATLASGYMDASTYTLTWDASNVSSGMYIVKAEAAGTVSTQKLMLMK